MNGDNDSTTFVDEYGKTWTASGNAKQSTAQQKFGSASGVFDGTTDYIYTADHADFNMISGNDWIFGYVSTLYLQLIRKSY